MPPITPVFTISVYDEETGSLITEGTVNVYDSNGTPLDSYSLAEYNPKSYETDLGEGVKIIVEGLATKGWTKGGVGDFPALVGNEFNIWLDGVEPFTAPPAPVPLPPAFPAAPEPGSSIADELYMQATDVCGGLGIIAQHDNYSSWKTAHESPWPPSAPLPASPGVAAAWTMPQQPSPSDPTADALFAALQAFDEAYAAWRGTTYDAEGNVTHLGYDEWEYLYNGWVEQES